MYLVIIDTKKKFFQLRLPVCLQFYRSILKCQFENFVSQVKRFSGNLRFSSVKSNFSYKEVILFFELWAECQFWTCNTHIGLYYTMLLPLAYLVCGKVLFSVVSVCLSIGGWGSPNLSTGDHPHPRHVQSCSLGNPTPTPYPLAGGRFAFDCKAFLYWTTWNITCRYSQSFRSVGRTLHWRAESARSCIMAGI